MLSKAQLSRSATVFLFLGFVLGLLSILMQNMSSYAFDLPVLGQMLAFALWMVGCIRIAQSKGYSQWYGALGLLCLIGLIVLIVIPDTWVEDAIESPTNYPRYPQP